MNKFHKINRFKIIDDHVKLYNLEPSTIYTVQIESRKELKRSEEAIDLNESNEYKYIVYSESSKVQFQTASPPDPPTNLSVVTTTCHAVKIRWDPPISHGSEMIGKIIAFKLKINQFLINN
jgi:hypothetical protein